MEFTSIIIVAIILTLFVVGFIIGGVGSIIEKVNKRKNKTENNDNDVEDNTSDDTNNKQDIVSEIIDDDTTSDDTTNTEQQKIDDSEQDSTQTTEEQKNDEPVEPITQEQETINETDNDVFIVSLQENTAILEENKKEKPCYKYSDDIINISKKNTEILNDVLNGSHKKVKLKKGCYPIFPTINVINCEFDLNDSMLYSTEYKSKNTAFVLSGNNVIIENGDISGTYDTPDDDPSYSFHENESLVAATSYKIDKAIMKNLNLHNCWGYAIQSNGAGMIINTVGNYISSWKMGTPTEDGYNQFIADIDFYQTPKNSITKSFLEALKNHTYNKISAVGNLGYNRIISDKEIKYEFFNKDNVLISTEYKIPRRCATIPQNASRVIITAYKHIIDNPTTLSTWQDFYIGLSNYENGTQIIEDCVFHNSHSLGMVGTASEMFVRNCESYEQGKPFSQNKLSYRSTVGFLDIEDISTPYIELDNCYSHDELHFFLDGGFNAKVTNCIGQIVVYRGWEISIDKHEGRITAISDTCNKKINITNSKLTDMSGARYNMKKLHTDNIEMVKLCDVANAFNNFTITTGYSTSSYKWVGGTPQGTIYANNLTGELRLQLATDKGTNVKIFTNFADNPNKCGGLLACGDCYGITIDELLLPNGNTIRDSVINISRESVYGNYVVANAVPQFSGAYENCEFNFSSDCPINYAAVGLPKIPMIVTYKNCKFNTTSDVKHFYHKGFCEGSKITFDNCTLNGNKCSQEIMNELTARLPENLTIIVV